MDAASDRIEIIFFFVSDQQDTTVLDDDRGGSAAKLRVKGVFFYASSCRQDGIPGVT
jgi:hypothetical protein